MDGLGGARAGCVLAHRRPLGDGESRKRATGPGNSREHAPWLSGDARPPAFVTAARGRHSPGAHGGGSLAPARGRATGWHNDGAHTRAHAPGVGPRWRGTGATGLEPVTSGVNRPVSELTASAWTGGNSWQEQGVSHLVLRDCRMPAGTSGDLVR